MHKLKFRIFLLLLWFSAFFCYGINKKSDSPDVKLEVKVYRDTTNSKNCMDIPEEEFTEIKLPYYPGFTRNKLWLDIRFNKYADMENHLYNLVLKIDYKDYIDAFILKEDNTWQSIKEVANPSVCTTSPIIPLMKNLTAGNDKIHIRICTIPGKGNPINIKLIQNKNLTKSVTMLITRFCFNSGLSITIFLVLLLAGLLLKDSAYLLLAFSAFVYILRATFARGILPVIFWNSNLPINVNPRIEYFFDSLEILVLTIAFYSFSAIKKNKTTRGYKIIIIESVIVQTLLIVIVEPPAILFIGFFIISIIQKTIMALFCCSGAKNNHSESRIMFLCSSFVFTLSVIFRTLLILQNFLHIHFPDFIKLEGLITSVFGYLLLYIPPLYSMGKRFNIRYQFVQNEYRNLEKTLIMQNKTYNLVDSVSKPVSQLASSVLNTASILSKLNFSAANAEYIELIKRESSKINDILVGLRIIKGTEEIKKKPILLLNFLNSCMLSIKRVAKEKKCTLSFTAAIANDSIVLADPRVLQLLFIINPCSIISISKPETKITMVMEEKNNEYSLLIANTFESKEIDSKQKVIMALNQFSYFEFLNELAKIYKASPVEIIATKENCRMIFKIRFDKPKDASKIKVVTDKTTFEISENSKRLFNEIEKEKLAKELKPSKNETTFVLTSMEEEKQQKLIKDVFDDFYFSTREKEIATLIIEGKSDKEIAAKLNISPQTVATHNKKIFKKAGVHSRVELINKVR